VNPVKLAVIVPALNEEAAVAQVVCSVREAAPGVPVFVIDDYSSDRTAAEAERAGADVVRLPVHLGLGGCVQTGYKLALELGYDYVIRVDGDGQHEALDVPRILEALESTGADVVIGSRFVDFDKHAGHHESRTSRLRSIGIALLRRLLAPITGSAIHDPTSGLIGVNRRALEVFAREFPLAWPEIGVLAMLRRHDLRFHEIPCRMYQRRTGKSSLTAWRSCQYIFHVLLYAFIHALRAEAATGVTEAKRWSR
jgi:glycosyltransferase involved in cell wall biosynthesis